MPQIRPLRALVVFAVLAAVGCPATRGAASGSPTVQPFETSGIRGANYCASAGHHVEHWLHYDPKETERDLDYARRIAINQVRVFLSYEAFKADPAAFRRNLAHLAHACAERHIGLMPVAMSKREMLHEAAPYPLTRAWVTALVETIGEAPALVCWDVYNEPDYPDDTGRAARTEEARLMASFFRELDPRHPRTPVTIGFAFEKHMEENADAVDVLSFHDYSPTRGEVRREIAAAVTFATRTQKPVLNSEIGCTARANPYDIAIEEYTKAGVGFYIWELMITKYWGNVHGVFYPDGSVRDPSIAAAMIGVFRNRSTDVVPEFPDRENAVTRAINGGAKWLADPQATYAEGLKLAETAANLLEANQLVAMHDLPTRRVARLQSGPENRGALGALLGELLRQLQPFQRPEHE